MVKKSRSLSTEQLDLIEFLVAQVTSLSSSLAMEVACEDVIIEPQALPSVECEVVELQSHNVVSFATPPTLALELHATGVLVSFEAKLPDLAALEVGPKGATLVYSH
jgi:hypothetical protein